jgi:Na+-driven multidrug efflux pump
MLAYIFYAAYCNFLIGIYLHKKSHYLPYVTVAGMLGNLLANYTLIPHLGIMGAAWARLIAYVIMAVSLYTIAQRLYRIQYEWLRLGKLIVLVILYFTCALFVSSFILKVFLFMTFPVALVLVKIIDNAELRAFGGLFERRAGVPPEAP